MARQTSRRGLVDGVWILFENSLCQETFFCTEAVEGRDVDGQSEGLEMSLGALTRGDYAMDLGEVLQSVCFNMTLHTHWTED